LSQECPELYREQGRDGLAGDGQGIDSPEGELNVLVWYLAQFNVVAHGISYLDGLHRVLLPNPASSMTGFEGISGKRDRCISLSMPRRLQRFKDDQ
jgi:hypothetical protein